MSGERRMGLTAAGATLLAAAPLSAIFASWTWLAQGTLLVAVIAGCAMLARTLRFPVWAQVSGMLLVMLLVLTWQFPSGAELAGVLPSAETFRHFGALLTAAGEDARAYGVPVPDRAGLLFVAVLGIGAVAIVVDLLAVALRRPALAGLPILAIYSVPVAVYVDSVPLLTFVIGACGYLWLLIADNIDRVRRFGRRFTEDGREIDISASSPLAWAGRGLAAVGLAVAVLAPMAVPGIDAGLLTRLTQSGTGPGGSGAGTGPGGANIDLFASLSGQLLDRQSRDLLGVTTDEKDPYYLRLGVADVVTQKGFGSRAPSGRPLEEGIPDARHDPTIDKVALTEHHATIVSLGLDQGNAPLFGRPIGVERLNSTDWYYDPIEQTVFSTRATTRGRTYAIDYLRPEYKVGELRAAPTLGPGDPMYDRFTTVPRDAYVDQVVAKLIKGKTTGYDKVRAIYGYFAKDNGFTYRLSTVSGTSGSAIEQFLRQKVGYCQQYAASMAWMVRAAGIPARVAFGFTRGDKRHGDAMVLTNRNAHAWTEVYFAGYGWVPFDPTPAASVPGSARTDWAPDVDPTTVTPVTTQDATAAPSAAVAQPRVSATAKQPAGSAANPTNAADARTGGPSLRQLGPAALVLALAIVLLIPAVRRVLLRRRRFHATASTAGVARDTGPPDAAPTQDRADAHAAWDELIDSMLDFRVPVDPSETPRHTAERLIRDAQLPAGAATSVTLLSRVEEQARYARLPQQGADLPPALATVRDGLKGSATRRTRIVAALMPPSVLVRWRYAVWRYTERRFPGGRSS